MTGIGRRRRRNRRANARAPIEDTIAIPGLVEYGGHLIFAVDFTSGGAPIGLQADDPEEECFDGRDGTGRTARSPADELRFVDGGMLQTVMSRIARWTPVGVGRLTPPLRVPCGLTDA